MPPLARLLPLLVVLAGLAACAGGRDDVRAALEGPSEIAPERSIVRLPEGLDEARLAVRRRIESHLLTEQVVLANDTALPRENVLRVRTRWRGSTAARFFSGPLRNPYTTAAIEQRIDDEFDGIARVSAPIDRSNHYGPYRYVAATTGDGERCVLAWQMIDATAVVTGETGTFAVDFRYCAPVDDPETLIAMFDRVELRPYL